jgi:hypothetical protein
MTELQNHAAGKQKYTKSPKYVHNIGRDKADTRCSDTLGVKHAAIAARA